MPPQNRRAASSERHVWIVGAGASKSHTNGRFPVLREIPRVAAELGILEDLKKSRSFKYLNSYLKQRLSKQLTKSADIDLESALTLLDVDLSIAQRPEWQLARQILLRLLRATFSRLADEFKSTQGEYHDLARRVGETSASIVTFNWDTLLDDALGRRQTIPAYSGRGGAGGGGSYENFVSDQTGLGETNAIDIGAGYPLAAWTPSKPYYIKAHGSIDWFSCHTPTCRNVALLFPMMDLAAPPICAYCLESLEPELVPPTLNKRLRDNPMIRRLWNLAAHELQFATHLTIWGYSLPPTDFYSNWLIRQANSSSMATLTLINPAVARQRKSGVRIDVEFVSRFAFPKPIQSSSFSLLLFRSYTEYTQGLTVDMLGDARTIAQIQQIKKRFFSEHR